MASPENQDNKNKTSPRSKKHSKSQKQVSKPSSSGSKVLESSISGSQKVWPKKQTVQKKLHLKNTDVTNGADKISNKSAGGRKKAPLKQKRSYSLRSLDRGRVLRSKLDKVKRRNAMKPASDSGNLVTRKKKSGKKKEKKSCQDELSKMRKHIKYMLTRMNYEQNLIDAYSGEGWKGQSAEKIRPEKELERAKSEILRCKLKIRHIFQHLDSLLVEGRLQESLFDSDGIDCENIFCGKCGSKDVSTDNDIILCDGICERGFHQKCLNPPLLSEDVPTGDDGWLCPHCDCKADCIDLLSEFRGTDLSIEDSWESIFPEAAVLENGSGPYDDLNLPSDDSEDDDYDPNARRVDENEQVEGPDYIESDSSSSSDDSTSSDENMNRVTVELDTDDSEDDDYDPEAPDPDKEIRKSRSSSDESDFTSDSDEFCDELKKISYAEEASASSLRIPTWDNLFNSGRDEMENEDKLYDNSEVPCAQAQIEIEEQEGGRGLSHKRGRERLDYKKLYDEEYGKSSSDSSEDEDWNEKISPKKLRETDDEQIEEILNDCLVMTTPKRRKKLVGSSTTDYDDDNLESHGCGSATMLKKSGAASKKLYEALQENQNPTKEKMENLAQELHMTYQQVSKWFGDARHSFGVSAEKSSSFGKATSDQVTINFDTRAGGSEPDNGVKGNSTVSSTQLKATNRKKLNEIFQENQYPSREMKEELAQELGLTFRRVSRWFEYARRRSHASTKVSSRPATSIASCRTPTSNVNLESGVSPLDEVTTQKSRMSPWKLDHRGMDLDSPIANGSASIEKGKIPADDWRKKAIAKELRKMRKRR